MQSCLIANPFVVYETSQFETTRCGRVSFIHVIKLNVTRTLQIGGFVLNVIRRIPKAKSDKVNGARKTGSSLLNMRSASHAQPLPMSTPNLHSHLTDQHTCDSAANTLKRCRSIRLVVQNIDQCARQSMSAQIGKRIDSYKWRSAGDPFSGNTLQLRESL
jgi:hypothetical protein